MDKRSIFFLCSPNIFGILSAITITNFNFGVIMKPFFLFFFSALILFISDIGHAGCQGETVTCFDGCSGGNITAYNSNSCGYSFDSGRGCNSGYGFCSKQEEPKSCQGQTITCFDGCSGKNITQFNADSCGYSFDAGKGCNAGYGYCSR